MPWISLTFRLSCQFYNINKNNISPRKLLRAQQMVDDPAKRGINYTVSFDGINNLWVTCRTVYRR